MERIRQRRLDPQTWRDIFVRFEACNLTVQEFCRAESLNDTSFYRWRNRLNSSVDVGKSPVPAIRRDAVATGFVDLGPLPQSRACAPRLDLKLDLGDGLMLHLVRG